MHIGFIMDGNRRWAKKNGLLKTIGHTRGTDTIEKVIEWCVARGDVAFASAWALAKKNVENRDSLELAHIYGLAVNRLPGLETKLRDNNVRLRVIGNLDLVPEEVREVLHDMERRTAELDGMVFTLAFAYGGQDEIVRGVRHLLSEVAAAHDPREAATAIAASIDEDWFGRHLDARRIGLPPPDLVIRTGGDRRHSGFLLYDSEYSEYYFTDTLWPDFDRAEFDRAVEWYANCQRNFGK
jgi:undecaprenyl diphosphate synthase